jgi:hypothetical protein
LIAEECRNLGTCRNVGTVRFGTRLRSATLNAAWFLKSVAANALEISAGNPLFGIAYACRRHSKLEQSVAVSEAALRIQSELTAGVGIGHNPHRFRGVAFKLGSREIGQSTSSITRLATGLSRVLLSTHASSGSSGSSGLF